MTDLIRRNEELARQERERFVAERARQEQEIYNWINFMKQKTSQYPKFKEKVPTDLGIDYENFDIRTAIPSWYSENSTMEQQVAEVNRFNAAVERINQLIIQFREEAMQLNEQFAKM